ncbi:MAG: response regulator [Acidobacteria bacterium]|nr:response regulator [Acidobacteriota bacterium]
MTILVVDDQPTNRKLLRAQLEAEGHAVLEAVDGVEALAALEREPVDAVISDILMPRMDGYRLCHKVRQHPKFSVLPVILYTSTYDSASDRQLAKTVEADGYVVKPAPTPVILDALHEAIQKAAERRRPQYSQPDEAYVLQEYSQVLVQKLEERNTELQEALERLQQTQEEILELNRNLERRVEERTAQLERVNQQLEIASAHKSRFLAGMSHELRTPLNSILGFAELLQEPDFGSLDDSQRRFVANIHTSGTHLLELINDILDLSKVAAGKIELHPEPVNVHEILQGVGDILRPLASRKTLTFTVHPADAGLHALADAARFKQVLYNLISNAIKFTPAGGHVDVRAVALPDAVQVCVQDDGIGIAEEDQDRIFEEFQQVDSALSRQFEGTGLGLALTRNFVRLQGGDIAVDSAPGKGSTFTFTLPRHMGAGAARPDVHPADRAGRAHPTILIVEDDPRARDLLTTHLTREGYDVVHAADGAEGVRKARESRPFAIVLDILLPLKSGWDVLSELKASPATTSIPVVIVSVVDDELRGFSLGAAAYLTKPVSRVELIAAVRNLSLTTKVRSRRVQILIVDDDPPARDLVVAAFDPYGFQLLTATSGREALRIITEAHPDLVVLDLMMPDVSGFEVVDAMRADPATAEIPVVILSAKDLSQEERERLDGQVTARLDKRGLSPQQLLTELRKLEKWFPVKTPIVDGLTALFNEVYFDKRLREEVARGQRYGRQFAVALVNIDDFGAFNAAHGRQHGDLALQQFSRLLENTLRSADPVARLGGDVFGVLLPETIGARAMDAAEKLRAKVQDEVFLAKNGGEGARLTVSVGLACYPVDGTTPDALTQSARAALDKARALNHNKVMAASPPAAEGGPAA